MNETSQMLPPLRLAFLSILLILPVSEVNHKQKHKTPFSMEKNGVMVQKHHSQPYKIILQGGRLSLGPHLTPYKHSADGKYYISILKTVRVSSGTLAFWLRFCIKV